MFNVKVQSLSSIFLILAHRLQTIVVGSPQINALQDVTESNDSLQSMTTPDMYIVIKTNGKRDRACPSSQNWAITTSDTNVNWKSLDNTVKCKFQTFTSKCGTKHPVPSYYYDIKMEDCLRTVYGHCQHALNNFATREECKESCRDKGLDHVPANLTNEVLCHFQPDFGNCNQYLQKYYYDINEQNCRGFAYSGCGGNGNRFSTFKRCQFVCDDLVSRKPAQK